LFILQRNYYLKLRLTERLVKRIEERLEERRDERRDERSNERLTLRLADFCCLLYIYPPSILYYIVY
jgi:hypothetical protein